MRSVPPPNAATTSASEPVDMHKYGNAKSISSDAYFGRNAVDDAAGQVRLLVATSACWWHSVWL